MNLSRASDDKRAMGPVQTTDLVPCDGSWYGVSLVDMDISISGRSLPSIEYPERRHVHIAKPTIALPDVRRPKRVRQVTHGELGLCTVTSPDRSQCGITGTRFPSWSLVSDVDSYRVMHRVLQGFATM
jgi:hypothetical protein